MGDTSLSDSAGKQDADAWDRWSWIWHAVFAGSLVGAFLVLQLSGGRLGSAHAFLFAGLPLWHWGGLWLAHRGLRSSGVPQWPRIIVIAGDIAIWFLLVQASTAFYVLLIGLYGQVFRHLRIRYAAVASGSITVLLVVRETVGRGVALGFQDPVIWIMIVTSVAGVMIALYISSIARQSRSRKELVQRLEATQTQLGEAIRRQAVLEERQRLSREIHDTLAQGFTSIVIHLQTALAEIEQHPERSGQARVERAIETARRSLDEARRVVRDLRPVLLEETTLVKALRRTAARWQREHGPATTVSVRGTPSDLGGDREVALYRATEEALANVLKHAGASTVRITVSYTAKAVELEVRDDGAGMDAPEQPPEGRYGIRGMRERAQALGGTATISSERGRGTTVTVSLPVEEVAP